MDSRIKENLDLFIIILWGVIAALVSWATLGYGSGLPAYFRWVIALPFLLILSGYPLTTIFYRTRSSLNNLERLALSSGFSLLLMYPAGILNILIIERKTEIFRPHLVGFMFFLVVLTLVLSLLALYIRHKKNITYIGSKEDPGKGFQDFLTNKTNQLILLVLVLSMFLNLANLNRADIYGDEYGLSFIAYDLVDGNTPGRQAYLLSTKAHSPLATYITHGVMQVLNPTGYYNLDDWMIRFANAIGGTLSVLAIFVLAAKMFGGLVGLISALFLAFNNYTIWLSRINHKEIYVLLFVILALYAFYRFVQTERRRDMWVSGILLGGAFMVKFTTVVLVPIFLIFILLKKRRLLLPLIKIFIISGLVFSPVIIFNIAAYTTTGYMDLSFGKIFGAKTYMGDYNPGTSFNLYNIEVLLFNLIDIYSIPIFALFVASFIITLKYLKENKDAFILLWLFMAVFILYFWFLGVRSYYAPFLTIPFAIATAFVFSKLRSKYKKPPHVYILGIIILLLILWSALYAYNTNISDSYTYIPSQGMGEWGRSDSPIVYPDGNPFSRIVRVTTESYGFKELSDYIIKKTNPGDTVLLDDRMDLLATEWYFEGKKWNLTYGEPFPLGRLPARGVEAIKLTQGHEMQKGDYAILISDDMYLAEIRYPEDYRDAIDWAEEGELIKTINDNNNNPTFYVYRL